MVCFPCTDRVRLEQAEAVSKNNTNPIPIIPNLQYNPGHQRSWDVYFHPPWRQRQTESPSEDHRTQRHQRGHTSKSVLVQTKGDSLQCVGEETCQLATSFHAGGATREVQAWSSQVSLSKALWVKEKSPTPSAICFSTPTPATRGQHAPCHQKMEPRKYC